MKQIVKKGLLASLLIGMGAISNMALAANATANLQTTATLNTACAFSAANVVFGNITPAATGDAAATLALTAICTKGAVYTFGLSTGSGGSFATRQLSGTGSNTDKLSYNIYQDAAYTTIAGDGTGGYSRMATSPASGLATTYNMYAKLPLNQYVKPDNYSDIITATLFY